MMRMTQPVAPITKGEKDKKKGNKDKKDGKNAAQEEDFSAIVQQSTQQTMLLFPFLYMFLSYGSFESGVALYWIVTNTFVIIQQLILNKMMKKPNSQPTEGSLNPTIS